MAHKSHGPTMSKQKRSVLKNEGEGHAGIAQRKKKANGQITFVHNPQDRIMLTRTQGRKKKTDVAHGSTRWKMILINSP